MKKRTNKIIRIKWHIKPRIFIMLLLLMVIIFASVFLVFNLFINAYIDANVESQLNELTMHYRTTDRESVPDEFSTHDKDPFLPDVSQQSKNKIGIQGEVLVLDEEYNLIRFHNNQAEEELEYFTEQLKKMEIPLDAASYFPVKTQNAEYYVAITASAKEPDTYLVFYVDVTAINSLVDTFNLVLAVIVAAAMLICFLIANIIANSVTTPIRKLSAFAAEIGNGYFQKKEFSFTDMELEELAEAMNQSAETLDKYDNEQRTFFQNASHELRSPLMSIRCYAEGIECGVMDANQASKTILLQTDRLSELVEDLLYISRIDNITSLLEKQENDLRETLSLCASSMKLVADKNELQLKFDFDDEPVLFTYNEKHLYRAIINLISNALRYAKSSITLSCHRLTEGIEIVVRDDGAGISAEDMPHIFERFYKGPNGKHGIGLSIVQSVIERHGGEITVSCENGTAFIIHFTEEKE
ncbi:HAMP domain-containing sensor histidine kinase [Anaerosporobacter sp.]|uniref:HAMP domain-containing sensor histidine kinase n=1 Tax=Anaerosporobacter sp. TaxID=1872529 RepID=UPI00286ED331|nr:HAMP domain-containing sensor histidine kinase [Anaerosporobacter sp.]